MFHVFYVFSKIVPALIGLSLIAFPRQIHSGTLKMTLKERRWLSKLLGVQEEDIPLWMFGCCWPDAPKLWTYRILGLLFLTFAVGVP